MLVLDDFKPEIAPLSPFNPVQAKAVVPSFVVPICVYLCPSSLRSSGYGGPVSVNERYFATSGWWEVDSKPNVEYETIRKEQANRAFTSLEQTRHRAMSEVNVPGVFGHKWKMEKRPYQC